jgi:hypothetical protein
MTQEGFFSQSLQTHPSLKGEQMPSSTHWEGLPQNESDAQSGHTQSSAVVHDPSVTQPMHSQLSALVQVAPAPSLEHWSEPAGTHTPEVQTSMPAQVPHEPPQPSSPHFFSPQLGTHATGSGSGVPEHASNSAPHAGVTHSKHAVTDVVQGMAHFCRAHASSGSAQAAQVSVRPAVPTRQVETHPVGALKHPVTAHS